MPSPNDLLFFLGLLAVGAVMVGAFFVRNRNLRLQGKYKKMTVEPTHDESLRNFERVMVEFPSGPFRERLEELHQVWKRVWLNSSSARGNPESHFYQLQYNESLVVALRQVLTLGIKIDDKLVELVDELIVLFEDLEADRQAVAQERLEAGLEVLRLLGPAGPRG